jgi:hypothetical protein
MKTQNLQKLVELKNFPLGPQAEKKAQLKKLKYLQPNHDDDYIFLVAICHIFADQKKPTQSSSSHKLKLSSYYYREDKTPVLHNGWYSYEL